MLSLKLVKNTRFFSADSELTYKALSAFTVPGMKNNEPGCVEIEVIAAEAGDTYNTTSSVFSIPGLKNTEYYTTILASIEEGQAISGGTISEVKIVTEKDIALAEDIFKERYLEEAKTSLMQGIDSVGSFIYFNEDLEQAFDNLIIHASEDDVVDNFKVEGTITTKILCFRKNDIDRFIEQKLSLGELGKEFVPNGIFKRFEKSEEDSDNYALVLSVEASTYPKITETFLLNDIKGQSIEDALDILQSMSEIRSVEVSSNLFWRNKLPKNKDNIDLLLLFESEQD